MSLPLAFRSAAPEQTLTAGRIIANGLRSGDFIALTGPLGAGKTQLVKGIALGLGIPPTEPIISPTFVLVREYVGRLRLFHIDAYRLGSASELAALGLEEMRADPQAVVALEWADRIPGTITPDMIRIDLDHPHPVPSALIFDPADPTQARPPADITFETAPLASSSQRLIRVWLPGDYGRRELAARLRVFLEPTVP